MASKYIKSMRKIFKDDLNKCLVNAAREVHIERACEIEASIIHEVKLPHNKSSADALIKDKRIRSKKSLKELELWYESYINERHNQEQSSPDK
jgi:hypothetical protein